MPVQYTTLDIAIERFWSKVSVGNTDECWLWQAAIDRRGYGVFAARKEPSALRTTNQFAHRIAYIATFGQIPVGMAVCHHCDNPPCVNPKHLWLGTLRDNTRDMWRKGRHPGAPKRFQPGDQMGENNSHAKITLAQVHEIRAKAASGAATRFLAAEYQLNPATIRKIVRKTLWPNV